MLGGGLASAAAEVSPAAEATSPVEKVVAGSSEKSPRFVLPRSQALAALVGQETIDVVADRDGHFVESLAPFLWDDDDQSFFVETSDLNSAVDVGRLYNRETRAAEARLEQAEAQADQSLSLLLPTVSVRVSRGYEKSEPSVEIDEATGELIESDLHMRTDASLTVNQPLFDLPTYFDWRRRQAKQEARQENLRSSDGDAYISTVSSYLALVASRLQIDMTRDFEGQLSELLSYIEKRTEAGAASVSDAARVQARSQATRSSRLEQESSHAAAGIEFVRLTNTVPKQLRLPVPADIGAVRLPATFKDAVATAMLSNPEITTLLAEVKAVKSDQTAANGRFLPRLNAEYTDTYSRNAGGGGDSQRDKRLMMVFNWELYAGSKDSLYLGELSSRYHELRYRLDDQRRQVVQALLANYSALETTRKRLDSGYEELSAIATAAEAMSKRMLTGNQSLLDLLDVYDRYYQARSRLVDLHVFEMNTIAQILRLTVGAPWLADAAAEASSGLVN
ncbi:MAG: hypothetical protein C0621_05505 [Desulfuromonas sp.]|nr:MAG: hypothetical protein C0621_05505 [Desulfuromonas sp.]